MSDMNIQDKTIEHYAGLIIIMKEKLDIDISPETADKILYEWLTDKDVRKYLNNDISTDTDILKIHEEISSTSKNERISSRLRGALADMRNFRGQETNWRNSDDGPILLTPVQQAYLPSLQNSLFACGDVEMVVREG